jgi:drug/metabolite transporter (DMT)-like permease
LRIHIFLHMNWTAPQRKTLLGIILAVTATLIWSGNFIVAREVAGTIQPISLAFLRWLTATVILIPFAARKLVTEKKQVLASKYVLLGAAISGVSLFNTFVYIGAKYTTAMNLALIGTTSSPVFTVILARIFLKEKITIIRVAGMIVCMMGIFLLLSKGSWQALRNFHFDKGSWWVLLAALAFASYNIFAKKRPTAISNRTFMFVTFATGTLLLAPFAIGEMVTAPPVAWNAKLIIIIFYLGAGTSVISFWCWAEAINRLGAARVSLFGNLIPIFSTIEAVLLLNENFTLIHFMSLLFVTVGLLIANFSLLRQSKPPKPQLKVVD